MNQCLQKLKKAVFTRRNKIFFKYWSPSNGNNGFKEDINERISFPLNRTSVVTNCNEGFIQNIFPRDGKTASRGNGIWETGIKWFPLARKSVSTSRNGEFV